MGLFASLSDDFYLNLHLNTEMELPSNRETVLHFFERIQRKYPTLVNFYTRDRNEFVLEEEKEHGRYRWLAVESHRVTSGAVNPPSMEAAVEQQLLVADVLPFALSASPLDCETLSITMGFDFNYRGNHNELLAEALGMPTAFEAFAEQRRVKLLSYEPQIYYAIDDDCRTQCRVAFEPRTTPYHLRTNDFGAEQLSVYVTARRIGSLPPGREFKDMTAELIELCTEVVEESVVSEILQPIQRTIEIKSSQ